MTFEPQYSFKVEFLVQEGVLRLEFHYHLVEDEGVVAESWMVAYQLGSQIPVDACSLKSTRYDVCFDGQTF